MPIATRFAGSETIIDHGRTGFFLEGDTPEKQAVEISELVTALADNDAQRHAIGRTASAMIRANGFSSEVVAERFLDLYRPVPG